MKPGLNCGQVTCRPRGHGRAASKHNFSAIESFRVPGCRFYASDAQDGLEAVAREPMFVALTFENAQEVVDFSRTGAIVKGHKQVGLSKIAIVLEDFVFENQVLAKSVPGQIGNDPVILMAVVAIMGEDKVRREAIFQVFEIFFNIGGYIGKKAVAELFHPHLLPPHTTKKDLAAAQRFFPALGIRTEHNPVEFDSGLLCHPAQNGAAATDLDVITMRPQAKDPAGSWEFGQAKG
jgi:hypothetical protein